LGKPTSESTWIDEGELKKIDPELYAKTAEVFLSKPCFFQPKGLDAEA
jgi:hypothetical protein